MVKELGIRVIPLSQPIILEYANGLTETVSNTAQVKSLCLIDISGSLITCQRDIKLPIITSHTNRKTILLGTDYIPRGPGWLNGCTLLSHKVQSAGSNCRKVNGFFISDSHLSEIELEAL